MAFKKFDSCIEKRLNSNYVAGNVVHSNMLNMQEQQTKLNEEDPKTHKSGCL
jgi:hypothetical protein